MKKILLGSTLALTLVGAGAVLAQGGHQRGPERPSFAQMDVNGDGMVTLEEMQSRAGDRFAESDTNGDGLLSVDELTAAAERERSRMIDRLMERKDANGDGMLSLEEMAPPNGERMFANADADGDGAISLEEWEAAKEKRRDGRGSRDGQGSAGN